MEYSKSEVQFQAFRVGLFILVLALAFCYLLSLNSLRATGVVPDESSRRTSIRVYRCKLLFNVLLQQRITEMLLTVSPLIHPPLILLLGSLRSLRLPLLHCLNFLLLLSCHSKHPLSTIGSRNDLPPLLTCPIDRSSMHILILAVFMTCVFEKALLLNSLSW